MSMQENRAHLEPNDGMVEKKRPPVAHTFFKVFIVFIAGIALSVALTLPVVKNFNKIQEYALKFKPKAELKATAARIGPENFTAYSAGLDKELAGLRKKMSVLIPKQPYLIVNTSGNDFMLMKDDQIMREGMCSTGSYTILQAGDEQSWIFKTPRGMFKIQNKIENPVWKKPDWAFIEEGLPVPSANHPSRFEYGVLGDYALYLGQGYLIHGTLYKRFLGMPVTHGCVRMGDEDLEEVYKTLPIGSRVYIY